MLVRNSTTKPQNRSSLLRWSVSKKGKDTKYWLRHIFLAIAMQPMYMYLETFRRWNSHKIMMYSFKQTISFCCGRHGLILKVLASKIPCILLSC